MNASNYSGIKPTRRDYCQFIISTVINYTQTYMAEHHPVFSHDAINRYLMEDDVSQNAVWVVVRDAIRRSAKACLVFDDTVLDKRHSFKIELVRSQYSGNEHGVIKGIGVVNCVYANLETNEHWIIDWRIYDPDGDGKSKLDHVRDMLDDAIENKNLPFRAVLMDSWYATKDLMMHIDKAGKAVLLPAEIQPESGRQPGRKTLQGRFRPGMARRRGAARQARENTRIPGRLQGQTIPGRGDKPHGICRHPKYRTKPPALSKWLRLVCK